MHTRPPKGHEIGNIRTTLKGMLNTEMKKKKKMEIRKHKRMTTGSEHWQIESLKRREADPWTDARLG